MTRTLSAQELYAFLQQQRTRISNAFQQVEQVQAEYQGAYTRFKAAHDQTLQELVSQLEAQTGTLSPALQQQIDARVPAERQAITERIAVLDKTIMPPLQKQADDLVERGQQETAQLRETNPKLNDREEALKSDLANWQKQLDALNTQIAALNKGLGFILHAWQIHSLDRERFRVAGRIDALTEELRKVRQEWQDLHAKIVKDQAALQQQWQALTTQLGRFEQERDYLAQDIEALARHRARVWVLDNCKQPMPAGPPALDAGLARMIQLNIQTDDYQAALGAVAGILGTAKGVDEGLARFGESVKALIDEQGRQSEYLRPLKIQLPDAVPAFGATWDDLAAKAQDEKKLADHPADFVTAMKPFLDNRLAQAQISGYFNALGAALTQATRSWSSK